MAADDDPCLVGRAGSAHLGADEHAGAELGQHGVGLGDGRRAAPVLQPPGSQALLRDGLGHVGGMLPQGELDHAQHQ